MPLGLVAQALSPPAGLVWSELAVFALPAVALVSRAGLDERRFLRLGRPPPRALALALPIGLLAMVAGGAVQTGWAALLPAPMVETFDVTRLFGEGGRAGQAILVAAAVLLAPLCEELAFRGHLLSALLLRRGPGPAIALSALAFALAHLDPVRFPALLVLGGIYGWLSWRAGSVWPAVLAHAVNNAAATALALGSPEEPSSAGAASALAALGALAVSLSLLAPLVLAYQRKMPPTAGTGATLAWRTARGPGTDRAARAGRWPAWAVRAGWLAAAALALIGFFGRH
jgi:membrane protease YdiL (CAAX protease family)